MENPLGNACNKQLVNMFAARVDPPSTQIYGSSPHSSFQVAGQSWASKAGQGGPEMLVA